jgi:iron complex outermembrane recepter protein
MDKFTVSGVREGTALAITRQQQAPNVKNIVASDTFGNIADGNVGPTGVEL